jgi:hypothetical protein
MITRYVQDTSALIILFFRHKHKSIFFTNFASSLFPISQFFRKKKKERERKKKQKEEEEEKAFMLFRVKEIVRRFRVMLC